MSKHDKSWLNDLPEAFNDFRAGRNVDEVECIIPDLAGMSRGKSMPAHKFNPQYETFLPVSIFYQAITGDDVEMDIENQWAEGDLVLKPDMSTAKAVPWAKEPTLQVIHDLYTRDGKPVNIAPRQVLKNVVDLYTQQGWKPIIAPELEFYLIKPNLDPNEPIQAPVGRTGRRRSSRQSYSMSAVDDYGPVIDTIYDFAQDAGLTIDTVIQEDGAGKSRSTCRMATRCFSLTRSFTSNASFVKRLSITRYLRPSWPSPCAISRAPPCMCTRAW